MEDQQHGCLEVRTPVDSIELPATDLRQRLLRDLGNVELRQKYLATRTPEWSQADLRMASERLLTARLVRGLLGLSAMGAAGGAIGDMLAGTASSPALPLLVGLGSAISGAVSLLVLAALGYVVLPEIVGEEKKRRSGSGMNALLGRFADTTAEASCGGIWGALCGGMIGALAWLADATVGLPRVGSLTTVLAGAVGGALLAAIFGVLICKLGAMGTGAAAQHWGRLGPLPFWAYVLPFETARKRYLAGIGTVKFNPAANAAGSPAMTAAGSP